MEPLDLTQRPPRRLHEKLDGLFAVPRTIDKMRACLPGGNPGMYHVEGMSTRVLAIIGIDPAELQAVVARSSSEEEVGQWLYDHADRSKYAQANSLVLNRRIDDISPENKERFFTSYPRHREAPSDKLIDVITHDDTILFGAS